MEETIMEAAAGAETAAINGECDTAEETAPFWQGADIGDKLSYAASLYGVPEDALVEALLQQSGDDGARWQQHVETRRKQAEERTTGRLAAEFDVLSAQVPEFRQVGDVPQRVVDNAMKEGITLLDAYLREWYAANRQEQLQQAAAARSAGPMGGTFEEPDPKESAFSRAFRSALA